MHDKRRRSKTGLGPGLATTVLALACLPPSSSSGQVLSPGKLHRAHAPLETNCKACHGPDRVEAKRCLSCHRTLRKKIAARAGYHGRTAKGPCSKCHTDHRGRDFKIVRWPTSEASFDHGTTGYVLKAKHKQVACRSCHKPKNHQDSRVRRFRPAHRKRTYLGLARACVSCHPDPHEGRVGARCASCHSETSFKAVKHFSEHHRTQFPLLGKHERVPCAKCHRKGKKTWNFGELRFGSCADCHRSKHDATMLGGDGRPKRACSACHVEKGWRHVTFSRAAHPKSFPLLGAHARISCRSCHGRTARRVPRKTRCVDCHKSPHEASFGNACTKCHSVSSWRRRQSVAGMGKVAPSQRAEARVIGIPAAKVQAVAFHNKTQFPLTGKHIITACERCHGRGRRKKLKGIAHERCSDCHKDVHRGRLAQVGAARGKGKRRCVVCHSTAGWQLTQYTAEDHASSRFPLEGAHVAVPCRGCHARARRPAQRFRLRNRECSACHADFHRGKYRLTRTKRLPCATCHTQRSFREIAFDHAKTKLPLRGAHAAAACASCHTPGSRGIVAFRSGLSPRCGSCHADPHQGQFASAAPRRSCADCHEDSRKNFKILRFDHAKKGGWPLRGRHAKLACDRCHAELELRGGKRARLYRLKAADCASCHRSTHKRAGATRCQSCHDQRSWRKIRDIGDFDHGRETGYTLVGAHGGASCSSCHRRRQTTSRECAGCHADPHAGRLGERCAECHRPTDWKPSNMLARHRKTRLPLTGWHALADCVSCHPRAREGQYRGAPAACVACHADRYRDPALHPNHLQAGFDTRCETCHRPTGWSPAAFASRSLALVTHRSFALSGGHATVQCIGCHHRGRPSTRCVSCHAGAVKRASSPDHGAPGFSNRCEQCHSTRSWSPARADHQRWFPLAGKHRGLACADCHTDPTQFRRATCGGACHPASRTRAQHERVRGFAQGSRACLRCHPSGKR